MRLERGIRLLMAEILCICIAVGGLLTALEGTLFREGYLVGKMESTGYFTRLTDAVSVACQGYAADAGLNISAVYEYIYEDNVRSDLILNVDAYFRGTSGSTTARFANMVDTLQQAVTRETGVAPTEEQLSRYSVLQISCEGTYQEAVRPPFEAALNVILQYRKLRFWAWGVFALLGAGAAAVLRLACGSVGLWKTCVQRAMLGAALALVLAAVGAGLAGVSDWMPPENISYSLFCAWWGGFPVALGLVGFGCFVLFAVSGLWTVKEPAEESSLEPIGKSMEKEVEKSAALTSKPADEPAPAVRKINLSRAKRSTK